MSIHLTVRTNQEAFDAVKAHLATMPGRAVDAEGCCLYCTDDGRRCAVGVLLDCSDDEARELPGEMLGTVRHLIDLGGVDFDLLLELQGVHDDDFNWELDTFVGHDELKLVARKWGLTP